MDCSPPGSSLCGIPRQEHWRGCHSSSRGSFQPRDWTCVSCAGRQTLYHWATQSFSSSHLVVRWESGQVCIWGSEACWERKDNDPDSVSLSFHVFQWCLEDRSYDWDAQTPEGRELEWKGELVLASQTRHPPTGFTPAPLLTQLLRHRECGRRAPVRPVSHLLSAGPPSWEQGPAERQQQPWRLGSHLPFSMTVGTPQLLELARETWRSGEWTSQVSGMRAQRHLIWACRWVCPYYIPSPRELTPSCDTVLLLLLFSCYVVSDALPPQGLQHARLPCPLLFQRVLKLMSIDHWHHPTISSSVAAFSSCPQSFMDFNCYSSRVIWAGMRYFWGSRE